MAKASEEREDPTQHLPYEVSLIVFSFIPAQDLVNNCLLVCRFWKRICDDQTTWRLKCEHTGRYQAKYMRALEPDDWKVFYYGNPFSSNLLKNPNLTDAFSKIRETKTQELKAWYGYCYYIHRALLQPMYQEWKVKFEPWEMMKMGNDGICLECPPIGCCTLNGDADCCCIATYDEPAIRCQVVDLVAKGVPEYVLDKCKLPIQVYEWFNGRYDCGVEYYLKVSLRDKQREAIPGYKVRLDGEMAAGEHEWEKLEHVFRDYPEGVRFVKFKDFGGVALFSKRSRFFFQSTDYCGAKLTGATVKFLLH